MFQKLEGVSIACVSSCVPKNIKDNSSFSELLSTKELRIFEKTVGIKERRHAENHITAGDLGYEAAIQIFDHYKVSKDDIGGVVFLSQTADYKIPFTSNIIQHKLGLPRDILCLDINAGCAGFVQGLGTAFSILKTIPGKKILFIVAETLSKIISEEDRATSMLFGDGASACLLESTEDKNEVSYFNYFSDGAHYDAIMIPDGGYRSPAIEKSFIVNEDEKGNKKSRMNLSMDGARVFDFTLREVAVSIEQMLEESGEKKEEIDYFLFHQSNQFIIGQISAKLGIPSEKVKINIDRFGNTSGVSIPLLITTFADSLSGKKILCSGYGSGLNWGNCIINLSETKLLPLKEI